METRIRRVRHVLVLAVALLAAPSIVLAQGACADRLPVERITLNLRDANVQTTLRLLGQQYRVNMIVTDEVKGTVTGDFYQVPARDVFQVLIDSAGLQCVEVGGVLRVSSFARIRAEDEERRNAVAERARREADAAKKQVEAERDRDDFERARLRGVIRERTIRLSYADAEEVAKTILGILGLPPEGSVPAPPPVPAGLLPPPPINIPSGPTPPVPSTSLFQVPVVSLPADVLAKGLTVRAYKPTNSVFIRYYENDLDRIERLIKEQLDIPLPQVQIAATMLITSQNALDQLGIQWGGAAVGRTGEGRGPAVVGSGLSNRTPATATGTPVSGGPYSNNPNFTGSDLLPIAPTSGLPIGQNLVNLPTTFLPTLAAPALGAFFGLVGQNFNLNFAIQALEVQGKARRISEPKIVTVEHAKAEISRGFEVPFTSTPTADVSNVQFKDALLRLTVTPNVIYENGVTRIRMKVLVENNEPDFTRSINGNPPIFKRRSETEVVVKEGEKLVIGGIILDNSSKTLRGVPVMSRIPIVGWLFKSREVSSDGEELVVIITPSVVAAGKTAAR
ncbi:MAG TPA: secretin N-terminal domain-containing protein [Methylomirabilota bacterium]|nr:secretin N-terminal domain-containing protein [Methylomirabilota bacterium]